MPKVYNVFFLRLFSLLVFIDEMLGGEEEKKTLFDC